MKRLRSSDDLNSYGEKSVVKDWGRREDNSGLQRSSSSLHRSSYYRSSDSGRKVVSSSTSRYDRLEDDRESLKPIRKRTDYDLENFERRKGYDRHREGSGRGILSSSPRPTYGTDQMHRSESFSGPRRDFPKGFRSERDRPKKDGIASSWRRFGSGKDGDDGSRSSSEWGRGARVESKDVPKSKSPHVFKDAKSPAWSKDSGSERSKSVEGKRYEDMQVESGGPSSDREEGELEPDPQPDVPSTVPSTEATVEDKVAAKVDSSEKENEVPNVKVENGDMTKVGSSEETAEVVPKDVEDVGSKSIDLPDCQDTALQGTGGSRDLNDAKVEGEGGGNQMVGGNEGTFEEDTDSTCDEHLSSLQEQGKDPGTDNQVKVDNLGHEGIVDVVAGNELPSTTKTAPSVKDKGKSIALLPSNNVHIAETNLEDENRPMELAPSGDIETEGPSSRGFQFFSTDPIKKPEKVEQLAPNKPKDEKLALELSLSLPNVLLPIGSQNRGQAQAQAPGSPSHGRSIQSFASSFRTNSDGFTASMSFSGSQQFTHNPSCSLTHNALDLEKSVGSKPLFQGVDWKALADENKNGEVSAQHGMSSRENVLRQQSHLSQANSTGQGVLHDARIVGGSSKLPIGLERQLSFSKHLSRAQAFGLYESGPENSKDKRQMIEKDIGILQRSNGPDGKDQGLVVGADFAESIVTMIVSEPLHTMARRFNDMSGNQVAFVKEFALDTISNSGKKWQLSALQKALQKRLDITLDMLLNANRIQLEILVALKTGLREFLLHKYDVPSSDLAEIFLNLKCKNLNCRSLLPVDECDCKICSQRKDFCRECMCLVCSKFDMASNTCSWVGCDVCLHWCHADCGLRESHIRNGRSASGVQGSTEMQFYCVACDHPSEMFGFVKEVFQNFLKEWTAETLSRELEYVGRIFCASDDVRGKKLYDTAVKMLSKLVSRADLQEVQTYIMNFFTETNSERCGNISIDSKKELPVSRNQEACNGIAGSSQGVGWMKSVYPDKAAYLETPINSLHDFDGNRNKNCTSNMLDLPKIAQKGVFDELESIVKIKLAEAEMFRTRAEDARKESEALKRIAVSKSERNEEEYKNRIAKLRLVEAEDMRKQKVEELQGVERAYQEYFNMKMRMETDIKDLLLKMEATRRNLSTHD